MADRQTRRQTNAPAGRRNRAGPDRIKAEDVQLDVLAGHAGYLVRRFQLWIFQDFVKTLSAADIRPTQYSVLTVIGANPGLSQMAAANRLGIERARLVHLLDELEGRKLVRRVKSTTDRRSHALYLTAQGETALAGFKRLAAAHEQHVEDRIGKANRKRLLAMLAGFS